MTDLTKLSSDDLFAMSENLYDMARQTGHYSDELRRRYEAQQKRIEEQFDALNYLMQQFDAEIWECRRCGYEEATSTMDSAEWLRDWLATHNAALAKENKDGT